MVFLLAEFILLTMGELKFGLWRSEAGRQKRRAIEQGGTNEEQEGFFDVAVYLHILLPDYNACLSAG